MDIESATWMTTVGAVTQPEAKGAASKTHWRQRYEPR